MNKVSKGNYYRLKVQKYLEKDGYMVAKLETKQRIYSPKGVFWKTSDVFAADLLAIREDDIIFVQVKSNAGDIAKGIRDFLIYPYPPCVQRWVVCWEPRAHEPIIQEV